MTGSSSALAIDGLSHGYDATLVLQDISVRVTKGEIVCLLGNSGGGKTTLLRLIAGIEQPKAGTIAIDGEVMASPSNFIPAERRGVGFMFQDYALFPHLTVAENVAFGVAGGRSKRSVVATGLARVGMSRYTNAYPHTLSGGEQQRVALARALAPEPKIVLMDEPFSNLDLRLRDDIRDKTMAVLQETGTTAVIVTHDPKEAMLIADRIILMERGRIVQVGTPQDLYRKPSSLFVARFFSVVNELQGVARGGVVTTALGEFACVDRADGPCIVGIRRSSVIASRSSSAFAFGVVVSSRFLGEHQLLKLSAKHVPVPLVVHAPVDPKFSTGDHVDITVDGAGLHVFSERV